MLKTAFLTGSVSRRAGGLFTSVRRLAQSLGSLSGVEVEILGVLDDKTAQDMCAWLPLRPQVFGRFGPSSFGFAPRLAQTVERLQPDLLRVDGLWTYTSVASLRWFRAASRPYVVAPRGMLDPWALSNSQWRKRLAACAFEDSHLRQAACLHALCEAESGVMRAYGLRNPICVIPNGVDLSDDRGQRSEARGPVSELKANGRKVLLYLGRIHQKKGLANLLRAWKEARGQLSETRRQRAEEWLLAIAGWDQGGHEAELKRLATELGLQWQDIRSLISDVRPQNSLFFLGPQFGQDKAACYRDCNAFILPSFSEGLPMVVLEAWAYAKPVIMTPECNLPEGFSAGAALRIETSSETIAASLEDLFRTSHSTLRAVGEKGRELVAARFTWPRIAAEMKAVYDWVLGGGPKPACVITD